MNYLWMIYLIYLDSGLSFSRCVGASGSSDCGRKGGVPFLQVLTAGGPTISVSSDVANDKLN